MKTKILLCLLSLVSIIPKSFAQEDELVVHVLGAYESDTTYLYGANVYWQKTSVGTSTDERGIGKIPFHKHLPHKLIVSYVGFQNDTITVNDKNKKHYYVFLINDEFLETLEIIRKRETSYISVVEPIRTEILNEGELKKAACCDLSESFETNASVDVNYSDALTGAKEIKLLGLDGVYVEMLQQKIPALRGLASPFGLSYVPGPWLQSISISKGAGSILNGHESITGAINYQYRRPFETNPFYLDLFANHMGRYEANLVSGVEFGERAASVFAINAGGMHAKHDFNEDSFLDHPMYDRFNVMNRWMFTGEKMRGQLSISYLLDDRSSGQTNFELEDRGTTNAYGVSEEVP